MSTEDTKELQGKWLYRSLRNNKVLGKPFNDIPFGEGVIEFKAIAYDQILDSTLDMGNEFILTLEGEVVRDAGRIVSLKGRGTGVSEAQTVLEVNYA